MLESEISLREEEEIDAWTSTIAFSEFWWKALNPASNWINSSFLNPASNLGLGIVFHPNLSLYSFRFHFRNIIWVNFNFNFDFSWILIWEISLLFIQWFLRKITSKFSDFWFVNSSLSPLSKNIKLPNFYPHFIIRFDQIRKGHLKLP